MHKVEPGHNAKDRPAGVIQHFQGGNDWKGHSPNGGGTVLTAVGTILSKGRSERMAECQWHLCVTLSGGVIPKALITPAHLPSSRGPLGRHLSRIETKQFLERAAGHPPSSSPGVDKRHLFSLCLCSALISSSDARGSSGGDTRLSSGLTVPFTTRAPQPSHITGRRRGSQAPLSSV